MKNLVDDYTAGSTDADVAEYIMQVALGNRGRKEIKFVAPAEEKPTTQTFSGPEVREMNI